MGHTSTLTSKNQTTIPKAIVAALGVKPSAVLCYELEPDGSVRLTAKSATFAGLAATFPLQKPTRSATLAEMQAAVRSTAARKFNQAGQ
jgi:bifunctional DNA-binding transcriptional regulator/antitoxin component of YhaV-PrlF toxin-antitoxin module